MESKLIPLSCGGHAALWGSKPPKAHTIIDSDDFEDISKFRWSLNDQNYALRLFRINGKLTQERMHRRILKCKDDEICDHINGNRLDNRKENLRISTKITNGQNSFKAKHKNGKPCSSKYKGVYKSFDKWSCEITVNKKKIRIGRFKEEWVAAYAYNCMARFHFGEFARVNDLSN